MLRLTHRYQRRPAPLTVSLDHSGHTPGTLKLQVATADNAGAHSIQTRERGEQGRDAVCAFLLG